MDAMNTQSSAEAPKLSSLPGLQGVDHVGITVKDLDAAVAFYTETLGGVELFRRGPLDAGDFPRTADGRDWTHAHLNVPGARLSVATLRIGPVFLLELIQYDRPVNRRTLPPQNPDLGAHHVALAVQDVEQAANFLRKQGLHVMDGPLRLDNGPGASPRWIYFLDSWGNQMELIQR